jgi:hypothetical protein
MQEGPKRQLNTLAAIKKKKRRSTCLNQSSWRF